jgi:3-dehydroquinate synthase
MADLAMTRTREAIEVKLSAESRRYDIVIQPGLLGQQGRLGDEIRSLAPADAKILMLTDANLAGLYQEQVEKSLHAAGFEVYTCVIPAGEASKSLAQAQEVFEQSLAAHMSRKDIMLALGGGVVGDLAGFCASTYHRGMPLIQVPTTLVAQVDSAIGGKTAVNFGQVKNIVGTFHQPLRVMIDPDTLDTLPERERIAGLAEVVKYGLIETSCTGETGFFEWQQMHADNLRAVYPEMIRRCCAIKASVVMQDEFETKGLRYFLNLGHTFGHAYESLSHYGLLHGEAVAIGTLQAAVLAARLGLFPAEAALRTEALLKKLGLLDVLRQAGDFPPQSLLERMRQDKKNHGDAIRLVLPEGELGRVVVRDDIPDAQILAVLAGG